jgi:transketolase
LVRAGVSEMSDLQLDDLCVNTIRCLAVDAIEKARSGHPGTPLGAAALTYALWDRFLKHDPHDPSWPDRDRFVLSAGHASMLLYALLHLTGYDLSLEDIQSFRQLGSRTPGHPEYGLTPGVEATTGPLGQGFANGVGMAMAERWLAANFNRPGFEILNHYVYALVSDGDLQEGITSEAASLAGNLQLGKLIYLYDSNDVQQDGPTVSFTENVVQRFRAYGWNVIGPLDGLDIDTVGLAIETARQQIQVPNLIICKTIIGYGSPYKAGTHDAHGEPLGEVEARLTKEKLGWLYAAPFTVPSEVSQHMRLALERGAQAHARWRQRMNEYAVQYPVEAQRLQRILNGQLPSDWPRGLSDLSRSFSQPVSTRDVSGKALNILAGNVDNLIGGSADLAGSTRAVISASTDFGHPDFKGRNLRFGLREHAMGAIINGLALHGGPRLFCSTFLVFSDYMRPAIRLAALMKLPVIYLFTHDSIGVGEDGPTHQPVEQIMSLRAIPNLVVERPADAAETVAAWEVAISRRDGPSVLILSRQALPLINHDNSVNDLAKGGYIVWETGNIPQIILIATGSELSLALLVARQLQTRGTSLRVVSIPCWSRFDAQPDDYKNTVLSPGVPLRISIEAATTLGWDRYTGQSGVALGLDRFGLSAPAGQVFSYFGLSVEKIVETALKLLGGSSPK